MRRREITPVTTNAFAAPVPQTVLNTTTTSVLPIAATNSADTTNVSIIDGLKKTDLKLELFLNSTTAAAKRKHKNQVNNEVAIRLDNKHAKITHVPGLKTNLFPHQQTVVKAMIDLEQHRTYDMSNTNSKISYNISYNAAVLSEPVGSGKTLDILSVICINKTPRVLPDIMELEYPKSKHIVGFVRRKFKKFLKPTIIFVGSSVMKQWEHIIKTFTNLKSFSVNSIKELKMLLLMISANTVNQYNIILVKNGKITRPIELPDNIQLEKKNRTALAHIYNIIANLRQYCWARVVVDDFDTIRLPHNAGVVNGIFTWYISSTRKKMDIRNPPKDSHESASELLKAFDYGCSNIMYNHYLFHYLNVRNDIDFLKSTMDMPIIKYFVAIFQNPNNRYISLLGSMGDDEINRITEMLNGDAIGEAANAAGIKTTSVATLFEKILGEKFKQYRFAGDLLSFIEHLKEEEPNRLSMSNNPDQKDRYGKKDLLAFREIEYKYPGVNKIIDSAEEEYTEIKEKSGLAIQRVKDNIKHGKCPICQVDLNDTDEIIIVKCCGAVFCGVCGIKGQNLNDRFNKLSNGRCSNCRTTINIKDLLYIGDDIDFDKIENEEFEDEAIIEITKAPSKRSNKQRTKYTAVVDVIFGEELPEAKRVDMHIPNVMKGDAYLADAAVRKVLIFANYEETLKNIIKELDEEKIHYWRLMGGINDINETSLAFTNCNTPCALVVNSTKHCSGLNLQTATHLIFAHNNQDGAVESQVIGRGHRMGRKSPLNVIFMQYDNEYSTLVETHGLRELSADELIKEQEKIKNGGTLVGSVKDNTNACYLDKRKPTVDHHRNEKNAPKGKKKKASKNKTGKSKKRATEDSDDEKSDESNDEKSNEDAEKSDESNDEKSDAEDESDE